MDDWLSYRLSDLILFSPQAYYRMFAQYHAWIWPAQLMLLASAAAVLILLGRGSARAVRIAAGVIGAWWVVVAVAFHLERYATINWAAGYFAILFVAQALAMTWFAMARWPDRLMPNQRMGALLFAMSVLAPLAGVAGGRAWNEVEFVGATPDSTAIATLAFAVAAPHARWRMAALPLLWLAVGSATLWALDSAESWFPITAAVLAIAGLLTRRGPRA